MLMSMFVEGSFSQRHFEEFCFISYSYHKSLEIFPFFSSLICQSKVNNDDEKQNHFNLKIRKIHCCIFALKYLLELTTLLRHNDDVAQSAGAVEYTDRISAEAYPPPYNNECSGYDTKQPDGDVSVMMELWRMQITPSQSSLPSVSIW